MKIEEKYELLKYQIGLLTKTNEGFQLTHNRVVYQLASETNEAFFIDSIKLLHKVWLETLNPDIAQLIYVILNSRDLMNGLEVPEELNSIWDDAAKDYWVCKLQRHKPNSETVPLFDMLGLPTKRISMRNLANYLMSYVSCNRNNVFIDDDTGAFYVLHKGEKIELAKAYHEVLSIPDEYLYYSELCIIKDNITAYHGQMVGYVMSQIAKYRDELLVKVTDKYIEELLT